MTQAAVAFPADDKREFMLAAIRTARARVQMLASEIEEVGISLRCNMISAEFAVSWLDDIGAMQFINTTWEKCEVVPEIDQVPAASPEAAAAHKAFLKKMTLGGAIDRTLRGTQ